MSTRSLLRVLLASGLVLTGCTALLGVKDIYLDPTATQGGNDGSNDGMLYPDGDMTGDGGSEAATACVVANLPTDVKNCGRCGHDCAGGPCIAGKCGPFELATIADAPLNNIALSTQHVFVSTRVTTSLNVGGLWRIPKSGGTAELYVPLPSFRYTEQLAVLGDKLYFVVDDAPANGTTQFGGLYSCPLLGTAPCAPALIAAADLPTGIAVDQGHVFYGDNAAGKGLMQHTPGGAAPTVLRDGFGFPRNVYVDGASVFYAVTITTAPRHAKVFEALTDGGTIEKYTYDSASAEVATLRGAPNALLFTAYDYSTTTSGVVRRIPRNGTVLPCDYGANSNNRPYGLHFDSTRIFWTNGGEGASQPYVKGSMVSCPLAGCCTAPDVMWEGEGEPAGMTGDTDAVYFVTYAKGGVWKVAKP